MRIILLLHQLLLVCHHIFLLISTAFFYFLNSFLICRSGLTKYVFLFYHVYTRPWHLLLSRYCTCSCYMVFRSSSNYTTWYLFFIFEWNLLGLSYGLIIISHCGWNRLVAFELNIFVFLSSWGGLSTTESMLNCSRNTHILLVGQVIHQNGIVSYLNSWGWNMPIISTSLRGSPYHVEIRLNHVLSLSTKSGIIFVFSLIDSVVRWRTRNLLDVLIWLRRKTLWRLHVLIDDAFELIATINFCPWMLYLV